MKKAGDYSRMILKIIWNNFCGYVWKFDTWKCGISSLCFSWDIKM